MFRNKNEVSKIALYQLSLVLGPNWRLSGPKFEGERAWSVNERAELAADLLETLPPMLDDNDEGLAEARRRDQKMDQNPKASLTWEQLRRGIGR